MTGDGYMLTVFTIYAAVAIALTAWLARTLFRNGGVFLHDVFEDRPGLAEAVNRLLVTGFYMLSLGYAFFIARTARGLDAVDAVQFLTNRLALLLVTLAIIHFVNVAVFWRIRGRTEQRHLPPPVAPQVILAQPGRQSAPPVPPK
jgi:hypothetical protein